MKNLDFIKFKNNVVDYTGKVSRANKVIYFYPTRGASVRIYVLNKNKIIDKLGTMTRFKNSNEIEVVVDYKKCRFWLSSGARISYDNFSQSMAKIGIFDHYEFL